ncbi:MAG: sugar ABC transporter permease [Lachnospiraceae bacterium]|nr:sugar ABC transporter permease [Lachnospiraceae bacterium]
MKKKNEMSKLDKKISIKLFLYVLPGLIIVFLFNYFSIWGWLFAFFQYKPGKSVFECEFVGWKNFATLFGNKVMRNNLFRVLKNTFGIHMLGYIFTPLPMFFAIFLNEIKNVKFKKVVQTLTTLPHFIGWVVVYSLATTLFSPNGLVNNLGIQWGLLDAPVNFLASDKHVWITQVLWQQWKGLGWSAIIYFAAIAGIDQELYEAAMVDGAGKLRRIWYITIPHLIPTYFTLLIMSIGNFLNTGYDQFLTFGNALNKDYIEVLDLYVYNLGIGGGQISYSVAVGIMKSFVAFILFAFANFISKKVRGTSVF